MLDSPYVRRVAISLQRLGLPFEHQSLSVFRTFDQFSQINPVVKAPTLVCDDGTVLMDSTLMLQYAEAIAAPGMTLMPTDIAGLQRALHVIGVALAACEKSVQIHYERGLRPAEKQHAPWLTRVTGQALAAYDMLEAEISRRPLAVGADTIDQAGICTAVAWHFTQQMLPDVVDASRYPALQKFSAQAEALPAFQAAAHGDSTYVQKR
jgi:glutathione S-transferase